VICLDEMGPESAKSAWGQRLVRAQVPDLADGTVRPAVHATQEADYDRRGKGYVFGAFRPGTGDGCTKPYEHRTAANRVDFLAYVEAWLPTDGDPISTIVANLSAQRATDVLLLSLTPSRWEFGSQPKYAVDLNLIELWWKVLRALALQGRRFEPWEEVCQAIEAAKAYWNQHRHPFVWGRHRRYQPRRKPGIAALPEVS
jgi:transposase